MCIVAIIQARMGSTRLPGKVLKKIGNRTMLGHVVRRVQRAGNLDRVVVATTTTLDDDAVVEAAERLEVTAFRGSEPDVLDRYYQTARVHDASSIVRITADCPLIDPGVIEQAIEAFEEEKPDYASTSLKERVYPRGVGAEVMTLGALETAWEEAEKSYQRVHVTPYIYQHPGQFELLHVGSVESNYSDHRWTVDTPEDLEFVRSLYSHLDSGCASWEEVLGVLRKNPRIAKINRGIDQKELEDE
jgi:spore coat polysaccharide biosynthesis protein SpsF